MVQREVAQWGRWEAVLLEAGGLSAALSGDRMSPQLPRFDANINQKKREICTYPVWEPAINDALSTTPSSFQREGQRDGGDVH